MTPQFHERQILKPRTTDLEKQQFMRVKSARFAPEPTDSTYIIEPCQSEFPYKPDPTTGGLKHLGGDELHELYEVVGESPV